MHKRLYIWLIGAALVVVPLAISIQAEASGVAVTGTIVSPSGAALSAAGGFVNLQPDGPVPGFGEGISSNGSFTIPNVSAGQYSVQVNYGGTDGDYTGPVPFKVTIGSSAVDLGSIKLTVPTITGYVTGPDGITRVANTWVQIRTNDWSFNTGTNADGLGNFKFGGLGNGSYVIEANAPQGSEYSNGKLNVTYSGTALTGQVVRLESPNIMGTIKDPSGNPIDFSGGGWVNCNLFNTDHSQNLNASFDSTTGVFRFGTVPTGTYTLECQVNGVAFTNAVPRSVSVTSGVLLNVGEVRLTTSQIVGTVYAPDGVTPVGNANVQVHTDDWSVSQFGQSGQDGTYRVGGLPNGTYKIEVNAPWGSSAYVSPEASSVTVGSGVVTKNLQFVQATKFLTGRVTKSNGQVVSGANVNANKDGGSGFANAQTDSNGNYELRLSGGSWNVMVNPNMGPGAVPPDWFFSGPPLRATFASNSTVESQTLSFTVEVANASIRGRAVKPDGSPLTNGNVDVRNQEGVGNSSMISPDGSFTVNVKAGTYRVSIFTPDNSMSFSEMSVSVSENQTKDVGTLTGKTKAAKITGRVVKADGTGVPNVYMNAYMQGQPGWSNTQSDSDGNFVLAVTAGRWGVNIDQGRNTKYVYSGPPVDVDVPTESSTINIGNMTLTYADATITGSIVDPAGNVITGLCAWLEARPATSFGPGNFGPGYGGPVNCQSGSFSISVPSSVASTFTLALHTPPNAPYSSLDNQNVAVFANTTSTKNVTVKANDATVQGRLIDQNGNQISSCISSRGWFGDVHFERGGSWRGGEIGPDCSYNISLLSGEGYHLGYFIEPSNGFMMKPPDSTPMTIAAGTTTLNITVNKADATITGRVVDPNGNGVDAFVFAGNWVEFEGKSDKEDFKNELHSDGKTNPDGSFSLGVLKNHQYEVGVGLPPGSSFISAKFERVDMRTASTANITLRLEKALGAMSGTVKFNGSPVNMAFVHCWEENGGFTGSPANFGGTYSLNYKAGQWHCGADSFDGTTFYQSEEELVSITSQASIAKDFALKQSDFQVPPPVTTTFDAGSAQVISLNNGTTITIPSGALGNSGSNVTVTATPTVNNLFRMKNAQPFGVGYDLTALDASNNEITTFNSNVTVTFTYTDEQLEKLGLSEDTLLSKYFDETTSTYQSPIGITQDKESNTITIQTNHFTTFVLVSGAVAGGATGPADIIATPASKGGPQVILADENGKVIANFFAYSSSLRIGVEAVTGDTDGDGTNEIIVAPGPGAGPQVRVFNKSGRLLSQFFAYGSNIRTGIHVTSADTNGDGKDEIITSPMAGAGPQVRVFTGNGALLHQFFAYNKSFRGGMKATTGDVDGDGVSEIITAPDSRAGSEIGIFETDGKVIKKFNAYASGVWGGFNVTAADMNGDGNADVIVAPKAGLGPQVSIFNKDGKALWRFFAFASTFRGGVNVSAGDVDGNGSNDIVVSPMSGAGPQVRIFSANGKLKSQFFAYLSSLRGSFSSFTADLDGDGKAEVVVAPGAGMGPQVRVFNQNGRVLSQYFSHHSKFRGGINIFAAY